MTTSNRTLIALALAAALASPMAFASGDKPAGDPPTKANAQASSRANDAVSSRTTTRETGRMMESPVHPNTAVGSANPPPGKGNWWADADIDGDGKLSAAEAKANAGLDSRFGSIDANADGYVSMAEYRKFYTSEASQGEMHARAHSAVVTRDVWVRLDGNDDGKLSSSEVSGDATLSGAFTAMDANGDGFVTQAEYAAYAKKNL